LLKDMLEGAASEQDDTISASQYNAGRQTLAEHAPDLVRNLPILQPGPNYRQQLANLTNVNGFHHAMLMDAAAVKGKAAETAKATSEAGLAEAKTPGAAAESRRQELVTKAMKDALANPQQGATLIDGALPASMDPQANSSYKAAWQAAMQSGNMEAAAHIVAAAAGHSAQITFATNPQVKAAEVKKAVDVATATAPIETAKAVATARATAPIETAKAIATAKALRQGDNPAVAGVAPAAVGQVQNSAVKLDETYIKAKSVTDSMGHLLDLAEHGNKAAGSNIPLVGVETLNAINGIKRINSAEIAQYSNAGSLLDQIKGKIGKLAEGKPIPQDVMDDIRELHHTLGQQAYQEYTDGLRTLNTRTGSTFAPALEAPNIRRGAGAKPAFKVGDTVMYNGARHKVTGIKSDGKLVLDGNQ
jgi:hypothetical protein